jgi:TrpR-related protein YerC/YecD
VSDILKKGNAIELADAICLIDDPLVAESFLADLCTPQEIKSLKERWLVCQLLDSRKFSYREVREITGASTTTITRVSRFLNNETNKGYRFILDRIKGD